jgi:hypothetical protein
VVSVIRIQRRRTKGWRMPEGAVYVGRPTRWGNPFAVGRGVPAREAVTQYREYLTTVPPSTLRDWLEPLRSATALCCWCPLDHPCHADVLIELLEQDAVARGTHRLAPDRNGAGRL